MNCPTHNVQMLEGQTRYGIRYFCPVEGCTMVAWDKETSTPADEPTRQKRILAHRWFDSLWKSGQMSRKEAYKWLQDRMGLPKKECHIGMFSEEQCNRVVKYAILKSTQKRGDLPVTVLKSKQETTVR